MDGSRCSHLSIILSLSLNPAQVWTSDKDILKTGKGFRILILKSLNTELHRTAVRTQWWRHDPMCCRFYNSECARCLELQLSSQSCLCKGNWTSGTVRWAVKAGRSESLLPRAWWTLPPGGCSKVYQMSAHPWVTCRCPPGGCDSAGLGLDGVCFSSSSWLTLWSLPMSPFKEARF